MITDYDGLLNKTYRELREFAEIYVVGVSGGADSTLVACICSEAAQNNKLGIEPSDCVLGVLMPNFENDAIFTSTGEKLVNTLNINNILLPITNVANEYNFLLKHTFIDFKSEIAFNKTIPDDITKFNTGNMLSRCRMTMLYSIAAKYTILLYKKYGKYFRVRVIGTDNLSENYIAYFTKYGDGGVDMNPIVELFKSEVYELLDYFKENGLISEDLINRVPSAGLWEGQTDENELGITYSELEYAIRRSLGMKILETPSDILNKDLVSRVNTMHDINSHKNEPIPYIQLRDFCE